MSYQVLARKWRPRNFTELLGQEHVLRALINALDKQRLHHAYLFTGTRGVGKTSIARILAKCLNCEKGVSSNPCGTCSSCTAINEGTFIDLIEVDAASRTKVEDTRELLENVQYAPTRGRYKIYLIDEVHMLSTHSFNALLKTLEEPPPHVKFLLATTDPQKLPVTVLSRCLQFHLKHLSEELIVKQMAHILKEEKIPAEEKALQQLAHASQGSMRDGLSLLDQAIAFGEGSIKQDDVCSMLGTIEQNVLERLLQALSQQDGATILKNIEDFTENGVDFYQAMDELISIFQQIAIAQIVPEATKNELAKTFANQFSKEDIQLYYQISMTGKRDLPFANSPKAGFEMTMLRLLAFHPAQQNDVPPSKKLDSGNRIKAPATQAKAGVTESKVQHEGKKDDIWHSIAGQLTLSGLAQALANNCVIKSQENDQLVLALAPQHTALLNEKTQSRLQDAINSHYGHTVKLTVDIEQSAKTTPAKQQEQQKAAKEAHAEQTIHQDSNVQQLMDTFSAKIVQTMPVDD